MDKIKRTRLVVSAIAVFALIGLAYSALFIGESEVTIACITFIGGIAGYYNYVETKRPSGSENNKI